MVEGRNGAGSSRTPSHHARRTRTIWQFWPVPALSGLLPPTPGTFRGRLPSASPPCHDRVSGAGLSPPLKQQRLVAHRRLDQVVLGRVESEDSVGPGNLDRDDQRRNRPVAAGRYGEGSNAAQDPRPGPSADRYLRRSMLRRLELVESALAESSLSSWSPRPAPGRAWRRYAGFACLGYVPGRCCRHLGRPTLRPGWFSKQPSRSPVPWGFLPGRDGLAWVK